MTTTEPEALLRLLAWLSPAFPTGGFAYSHGLEWAVEAGDVRDRDSLREWLRDVLAHGSGRSDAILLRHAHRACNDPVAAAEIAALARAAAPARERRLETVAQGEAFGMAAAAWIAATPPPILLPQGQEGLNDDPLPLWEGAGGGVTHAPYPVAVGMLAGSYGVPEHATTLAYLHAFTSNLISAGVRLIPLGQSAGVAVLAALEPTLLAVADDTRAASLEDVGGCAFRSDIAAMRHETQYTRLFRS